MTHSLPRVSRLSGRAKPRVLLVDDHRALLDRVSSLLSEDFDVVGVFTDSRQAIDAAAGASPDVVVLDINMPGLNGFQAMRALKQAGSRAPVVFLTLLDGDEYVGEAFRSGARGYVMKRQLVNDLGSALDQVLHGRRFAPSLTSLYRLTDAKGSAHTMQLYGDVPSFLDGLATCFDLALRRGDATAIVANEDVREGLRDRLQSRGWDVGGSKGHRRFLVVDRDNALNRFMRNDVPDAGLLEGLIGELDDFRCEVAENEACRLTIAGNMAVSLLAGGNAEAAMAVESQWTSLTHDRPFFTMCVYPTSCFQKGADELWSSACAEHGAVSQASNL